MWTTIRKETFKYVFEKRSIGEYCETMKYDKNHLKNVSRPIQVSLILVLIFSAAKSCKEIYEAADHTRFVMFCAL